MDPESAEAAREQARKHGLTLGEWLNQSILAHEEAARQAGDMAPPGPSVGPDIEMGGETWAVSAADTRRMTDAFERLAARIDASERRAALSMTGLDRTVLGLAARVEDAEADVRQASAKVSGAVEEMRRTGDVIVERATQAELLARETAGEINQTLQEFNASRQALAQRLADAEGAARRAAEQAAAVVHNDLAHRIENAEAFSREVAAAAAEEIRAAQAALAERMAEVERDTRAAAADAVRALRADQEMIQARIAVAETGGREAAAEALRELHASQAALQERMRQVESETRRAAADAIAEVRRAHEELAARVAAAGVDERTKESLEEIEAAQRALALRFDGIEALARQTAAATASEVAEGQQAIEARLEQIEQATREAAANLRMGAAAAINQVRAAQLDLEKRVKLVEVGAAFGMGGGGADAEKIREAHAALEERLSRIERGGASGGQERAALHMLDAKITGLAATVRDGRDRTASEIEYIRARMETGGGAEQAARLSAVEKTVEDAIARLADRLVQAENTANDALRRLESAPGAGAETEALRTLVEQRLDSMAASMTEMVGGVRAEIEGRIGGEAGPEMEAALADVNRRVAASERRQAQTIEAISIEIRRMSESIDRRLRSLETRNDDSAAVAVREEVARLATTLEDRINGIESREVASVERVGVEMGRLAERFDERFDGVERRSAEAIEHVGDQVARMAERLVTRQDQVARELTERIVESEERQTSRLTETLGIVASKLQAVEERTTTTLSPVQKAMTSFASRLQAMEDGARGALAGFDRSGDVDASPADDAFDDAAHEAFVGSVDLGDIEALVERISTRVQPAADTPAAAPAPELEVEEIGGESVDVESIETARMVIDPFDQLLPTPAPEPAAPPPPQIHADANDIDFSWDDPAPARAAPAPDDDDVAALFSPPNAPEIAHAAGRNDYLANARRAAQAASQAGRKRSSSGDDAARTPVQGLRGPNRVVLWSAAGALAVALAGGAYLVKVRANTEEAADPIADGEAQAQTPINVPAPAPLDPAALTPVDDAAALAPAEASEPGFADSSIADAAAKANAQSKARAAAAAAPAAKPAPEPERTRPGARSTTGPQAGITATVQPASLAGGGIRSALSLDQAALRGDAVAQYELGLQRLAGNQTPEGVALLRRAANQGLAMAQYRLAKLFERGEGVEPDLVLARQWTERAAAAGNRKAMHDLGVYYARGEGAPLDEAAAFRWFKQAAELGVADSQFNLGVLYQQGRGTQASPADALFWFAVAARSGDNDARARAATLEAQMTPETVQAARARAATFTARPASARANGEFGTRTWAQDSAQAGAPPRS